MSASNQGHIAFENGPEAPAENAAARTTGILPSHDISNLIARGNIIAQPAVHPDHIQPASLDLRLGDMAHRVRASFLPGPNSTVEAKIKELRMTRVDLTGAPVFEKDCVYIIPLVEELNLPENISGKANPKSTTGRLDIFTRLITDYGTEFDRDTKANSTPRWCREHSPSPSARVCASVNCVLCKVPRWPATAPLKDWITTNRSSIWTTKIAR
jgi:hypothetical protein